MNAAAPAAGRQQERLQAAREVLFCEHVLRKSRSNVLLRTVGDGGDVLAWQHYPTAEGVFDEATGAFWYYHCHAQSTAAAEAAGEAMPPAAEHGHFHCFVRPQGLQGPIHHLVAIGMDAHGKALRLFTVNQWVVGDTPLDVAASIALLRRFDIHLDTPSYLVNRWLCAILRLYEDDICGLLERRSRRLQQQASEDGVAINAVYRNRQLHVTSELDIDVMQTAVALEQAAAGP